MKVNLVHRTSYIVFALLFLISCQKESLLETVSETETKNEVLYENNEGMTIISERKKNPFTVVNMRKAYANLNTKDKNGNGNDSLNIRTTHLYVKFLPQDSTEIEILEQLEITDNLNLFDYPLDVDILIPGTHYHDPTVPANMPTPKYTAVTFDYMLPQNVSHIILDSLYLPETDLDTLSKSINAAFIRDLENEAFKLTNNLDDIVLDKGGKFKPSGYMKVENNSGGSITTEGVPFVKVTARYWFTIESAFTNNSGYYLINHEFKNEVNYQMKFNHQFAKINQSPVGTIIAYKDGPKQKSGWSYTSWKGMQSYLWKVIMRGVFDWHFVHQINFNLPSAPTDLKIRANTGGGNQYCTMIRTNLQSIPLPATQIMAFYFNDIRVGNPNETYWNIYRVTVHEIAHAAHWYALGSNDAQRAARTLRTRRIVREGWACAFTDHAMKHKFRSWRYNDCGSTTTTAAMEADKYPRMIGQDLWDNVNQSTTGGSCQSDVVDNVSSIPLSDIFSALQTVGNSGGVDSDNYRIMQWRNNIVSLHPNQATEIHNYFSQYIY